MTHLHTIAKLSNEIPFVDTYFSISCMRVFIYICAYDTSVSTLQTYNHQLTPLGTTYRVYAVSFVA
jgi:hypothetical protein